MMCIAFAAGATENTAANTANNPIILFCFTFNNISSLLHFKIKKPSKVKFFHVLDEFYPEGKLEYFLIAAARTIKVFPRKLAVTIYEYQSHRP